MGIGVSFNKAMCNIWQSYYSSQKYFQNKEANADFKTLLIIFWMSYSIKISTSSNDMKNKVII